VFQIGADTILTTTAHPIRVGGRGYDEGNDGKWMIVNSDIT